MVWRRACLMTSKLPRASMEIRRRQRKIYISNGLGNVISYFPPFFLYSTPSTVTFKIDGTCWLIEFHPSFNKLKDSFFIQYWCVLNSQCYFVSYLKWKSTKLKIEQFSKKIKFDLSSIVECTARTRASELLCLYIDYWGACPRVLELPTDERHEAGENRKE